MEMGHHGPPGAVDVAAATSTKGLQGSVPVGCSALIGMLST